MKAFQVAVSHLEKGDTMGERMGRIGRIQTDFFWRVLGIRQKIPTE